VRLLVAEPLVEAQGVGRARYPSASDVTN